MSLKINIEKLLTIYAGSDVIINDFFSVGGGSINEAYKLNTNAGSFFMKKNSAVLYPRMFQNEAQGIKLLYNSNTISTPEVVGIGESGDEAFLILNFIESGLKRNIFWENFGQQLAALHKITDDNFGLDNDNYIGSLKQSNGKHSSWSDFYREERLEKQVRLARNEGKIDKGTVIAFDSFYSKLDNIFPKEPPSLLHGDLWGGNFMVDKTGNPVIIDPAVYYGHREMDLGMSQLFGGFDRQFYTSYNKHYPIENGWEERMDYCNLYPLMVHVNLFGGGYIQSVKSILQKF